MEKGKRHLNLLSFCYSELYSFVEFETSADLQTAVEKLDGREFKGGVVHCTKDVRLS